MDSTMKPHTSCSMYVILKNWEQNRPGTRLHTIQVEQLRNGELKENCIVPV